jgi:hypothetical protein
LINCFAGCGAINILDTLGLQWSALFPPRRGGCSSQGSPSTSQISARDLLEIVSQEVSVVATVAADMLANKTINDVNWQRLAQAAARIADARDQARGSTRQTTAQRSPCRTSKRGPDT